MVEKFNKKENDIFVTNDYSKFKMIKGNRTISKKNYAKLYSSMSDKQLRIPICVNEKMEIIDGQHRYKVCKELGLPIRYHIEEGYSIPEVKIANMVASTWKKSDFLHMFLEEKNEDYLSFQKIIDQYKIKISDLLCILSVFNEENSSLTGKNFEKGEINLKNLDKAIAFLNALEDFKFFDCYKTKQFIRAFLKLYCQPTYDHNRMLDKLKLRSSVFKKKGSIDEYLVMLATNVYSCGASKFGIFYDSETRKFY